ncbi:GNAT family N-acetyltransferase [[Clostridium] colinum]|uniref:GNAT family N-acetyltransferase n=1 Tax=[Clostridium] colinum TaxID=36835 RepID=UPI0020256C6A|nr:GNAT family N-acetyltransferase [[Clostridium] colinum]
MNIEFEKVTKQNRRKAYKLKVFKNQQKHIETVYDCIKEARRCKCWKPTIIKIDNKYVGFAMYGLFKNEGKNGRVWLDRFLIDRNYQNMGYANLVLPILLEKIKSEYNYNKIYLSVYEDNYIAIKFYKKLGFNFNGETDINGELVMFKFFKEEK